MRSVEELQALSKACREAGVPMSPLTTEEKARAFGDAGYSNEAATKSYEDELVRRFDEGLPLTKYDKKRARLIKRARVVGPC